MTDQADKVREQRLRRAADRQWLRLEKVRRRDPRARDYNTYTLTSQETGDVVGRLMSIDDVERYLTGGDDQ